MLTEHQKKALDFQHHLSVTANAGAGKTTVLVQRFVEILTKTKTPVKRVVAITFTEKAASELRKKIAEHVGRMLANTCVQDERQALERIRDQLSSANIGTIHSFCAQLLRELPVEADVDAAFTVLEGIDQKFLEEDAIRETFDVLLKDPAKSNDREEVFDLIRMLGQRVVQKYLKTFLRQREHMERLLRNDGWLSDQKSDSEVLQFWKQSTDEFVLGVLDDARWLQAMQNILDKACGTTVQQVIDLFGQWKQALSPDEKVNVYDEILSSVLTQKGTLRKEFIGTKTEMSALREDELVIANHRKSIESVLAGWKDRDTSNKTLLTTLRTLLKLYRKIVERYTTKKNENGQLDFDDLQMRVRELLQEEGIRQRIADKYSYIMVDEYQDTNQLQYEILRLLLSNFQKGNLCIVGDPKQSIYGFRSAEVEIVESTEREIMSANGQWAQGNIVLAESFRLLPAIADFVNRVFSKTMGEATSGFNVRYDQLIKGRSNDADGRVELLLLPPSDNDGSSATNFLTLECEGIARRIAELSQSGYTIFNENDEQPHPFEFKNAAILLRNRIHIHEIEKALLKFGIPYQLFGGIGFYQRQEVFDFLNYFSFLLNRDDDVALAGILRSPFFAISDAELFEISILTTRETFWENVLRFSQQGHSSTEFEYASKVLQEDLQLAHRLPIPQLLHHVIRRTGWQGTVSGLDFGAQNRANLQKLVRIAREFEGRGFLSLYDFVERLRTFVVHEEREGQASIDAKLNCVQVLTIHAAKGLEFPVVVLPFTHEPFHYDSVPYIDQLYGIGFKVKNTLNYGQEIVPGFYNFLQERSKSRTNAEEKRVFYVGCTRARDLLILSGKKEYRNPCYLQWTFDGLDIEPETIETGSQLLLPKSLSILDRHADVSTIKEINHTLQFNISLIHNDTIHEIDTMRKMPVVFTQRKAYDSSLDAHLRSEFYSATQIRTYIECPAKYYLKYCLGLPEQNAGSYSFDEEKDPDDFIRGDIVGSIVHHLLEETNCNTIGSKQVQEAIVQLVATEPAIRASERSRYIEVIGQHLDTFVGSKLGQRIFSATEALNEYSLTAAIDDFFLTGTIDRLYRYDQEQWHIIDYKTDHIELNAIEDRAKIYYPQMATYALLLSRFFHQVTVPVTLLFLRYPDSPAEYSFSEAEILSVEEDVRKTVLNIRKKKFEYREQETCATCSYQRDGKCILSRI